MLFNPWIQKAIATSLLVTALMPLARAQADDFPVFPGAVTEDYAPVSHTHGMIEIGGGMETSGGVNILLKVGFGIVHGDKKELKHGYQEAAEQTIWAHMSESSAALATSSDGKALPFVDVHFSPFRSQIRLSEVNAANTDTGALDIGATTVARNIPMDQNLMIRVTAVRVERKFVHDSDQPLSFYAQAAIDLLGAKMAQHASQLSTFTGAHWVGASGEIGGRFRLNEKFALRVSLGGNADFNSWFNGHMQSDLGAFVSVNAELSEFVQIFAKGSINGSWDSQNDFFQAAPEAMVGVSVLY
jgi:hypothetical protein